MRSRLLIALGCLAFPVSETYSQCVFDSVAFASEDGGCKDLKTGLVFGPDTRAIGVTNPEGGSGIFPEGDCMDMNQMNYAGYSDWRLPSIGEVEEALANGLQFHLDHFLDDGPDTGEYRWSSCVAKIRGVNSRYKIRFADGDVLAVPNSSASTPQVCVRGVPEPDDCFAPSGTEGGKGDGDGGGKGGKGKNAMLLPRSATGAVLLLPLCLVAGYCSTKRRASGCL